VKLKNETCRQNILLNKFSGDVVDTKKENPLECTGIELLMLDHGRQFRKDLIERTQCLKLLVAVTILTCPTDEERAETLNKWIQIAVDTKTAAGNLFGFSAIMLGLCMPQVRLKTLSLRLNITFVTF
jgi:SH2 domain-containing protein 3C